MSAVASISSSSITSTPSSSVWTRRLEAITTGIQHRTVKQQRLLDRTQAPGDCARAKTLIKSYISENNNDVSNAKILLKSLNEECSSTKNTILMRTTRALGLSFQKAIEASSEVENRLMERVTDLETEGASRKATMRRPPTLVDDEYDDTATIAHMPDDDDDEEGGQELQQKITTMTHEENMTAKLFEAAFHERNKEIGMLLEGVKEINEIMHDLNVMVQEQGVELDKVEDNMMTSHESAVKAAENLRKAAGHQKQGGNWWLFAGIMIFAIILIVSLVVASHL